MQRFKLFGFAIIAYTFVLSGCAPHPNVDPKFVMLDSSEKTTRIEKKEAKNYQIGQISKCYVGDPVISNISYKKQITESITSHLNFKASIDYMDIKKDFIYEVKGRTFENSSHYFIHIFDSNGNFRFLKISNDGNLVSKDLFDWYGNVVVNDYISMPNTKIFEVYSSPADKKTDSYSELYLDGSFKYSIYYNGKADGAIKLQYREYLNDMARIAFYQDLTYDLTESKIIRFKNYRIEVIKATNEEIEYKVISD